MKHLDRQPANSDTTITDVDFARLMENNRNRHLYPTLLAIGATGLAALIVFNPFAVKAEVGAKEPQFSDKVLAYAQNPNTEATTITCPVEPGQGVIKSTADCLNEANILLQPLTIDHNGNISGGPGIDAGTSIVVSGKNAQANAEKTTGFIQPGDKIYVSLPNTLNGKYVTPVVTEVVKAKK